MKKVTKKTDATEKLAVTEKSDISINVTEQIEVVSEKIEVVPENTDKTEETTVTPGNSLNPNLIQ